MVSVPLLLIACRGPQPQCIGEFLAPLLTTFQVIRDRFNAKCYRNYLESQRGKPPGKRTTAMSRRSMSKLVETIQYARWSIYSTWARSSSFCFNEAISLFFWWSWDWNAASFWDVVLSASCLLRRLLWSSVSSLCRSARLLAKATRPSLEVENKRISCYASLGRELCRTTVVQK